MCGFLGGVVVLLLTGVNDVGDGDVSVRCMYACTSWWVGRVYVCMDVTVVCRFVGCGGGQLVRGCMWLALSGERLG